MMALTTVDCPSCDTTFPVDPAKVPPRGVRARCSVCGGIFPVGGAAEADDVVATPPPEATADRVGPAAFPEAGPDPDFDPEPWSGVAEASEEPWVGGAEAGGDEPWAEGVDIDEDAPWTTETGGDETWAGEGAATEVETPHGEEAGGWETGGDEPEGDVAGLEDLEIVESGERPAADAGDEAASWEAGLGWPSLEPTPEVGEAPEEPTGWPEAEEAETPRAEPAAPEAELEPSPGAEAADALPGFRFGRRDPHDKAKRLARVLVSDIITYNPQRYVRALERDTLAQDFEEEIEKSWKEYVEQVGPEIATTTPYWTDALNDLLAKGREVF